MSSVAYQRPEQAQWLRPLRAVAIFAAWVQARLVLGPAAARMQVKIARLSKEMGLRSAEVIAFPPSRRSHPSSLLKLSQRAKSDAPAARARRRPSDRKSR